MIVATSAFGMGVDKANVRFVFHYDISDSIDSYFQEIGRAGRDGAPAKAILFYRPEDLGVQKFFKGGGKLEQEKIRQVAEVVLNEEGPVTQEDLKQQTDLSGRKLTKVLNRLKEVGAVEALPNEEVASAENPPDLDEAASQAAKAQEERKEYEALRIEKMRVYAELRACRREYILNYFGEDAGGRCGNCDYCQGFARTAAHKPVERQRVAERGGGSGPFPLKSRVAHKEWGKGVVEGYEGDKITVLFDEVGRKTLSTEAVVKGKLLEPAA